MLTEFNGEPVAGGTLPAMIWKEFVERVEEDETRSFDSPPYLGGASTWVVRRGGKWQLDNGYCNGSRLIAYFSGLGPDTEADCKPNEVSRAVRRRDDEGRCRRTLAAQPLECEASRTRRRRRAGSRGSSSARTHGQAGSPPHDDVTIWVSKAEHGSLPNLVGSSLADVQREAARLKIRLVARTAPGRAGTVLRQGPQPGVAVAPGLRVRLVVGDGSQT